MFHVRLLQLRFIQHFQSDYVFRLLLSRQVHVAEFPATERFAYIEVFQLFMFYYAFALKFATRREKKSVKLSLRIYFSRRRQSDSFRRCFPTKITLLLHQNRFNRKNLNSKTTDEHKKERFRPLEKYFLPATASPPWSYSLLSSSQYHSKKKALHGDCDDGVESSSSSSSQHHHHPVELISSRLRADDDDDDFFPPFRRRSRCP